MWDGTGPFVTAPFVTALAATPRRARERSCLAPKVDLGEASTGSMVLQRLPHLSGAQRYPGTAAGTLFSSEIQLVHLDNLQ